MRRGKASSADRWWRMVVSATSQLLRRDIVSTMASATLYIGHTAIGDFRVTFDQIRDDFAYLDEWEDRYRYLIELGRKLEPLPESKRSNQNKVRGCASQVWLWSRRADEDRSRFRFVGDSDAYIVRGLIAVLIALFDDRTVEEIKAIDTEANFAELGLAEHLSAQRSNGLRAMVKRIKADADAAFVGAAT